MSTAVHNQSLFSDYYLHNHIHSLDECLPDLESTLENIETLYQPIQDTAHNFIEGQTERQFIQPVLKLLGHEFVVQPTLHTSQGIKRPDYAFFANQEVRLQAQTEINTPTFFRSTIAIGDAKAWSRDLDRKQRVNSNPFTNTNPSYQIDFYLRETNADWGILTNGRQWRLYHRSTSYRLDRFFQIDLENLLNSRNLEDFRYFYKFFRAPAFIPDVGRKCFLDRVLEGSQQYAVDVSDDLEHRVRYALKHLMRGFLEHPRNNLQSSSEEPPSEATIQQIYDNALILLYRILFVLYAESRDLLPTEDPNYATDHSLASLAADTHHRLKEGRYIIPTLTDYWARLSGLFDLINQGWKELIPQYNGGLFSPRYPFLERNWIGNAALAKALDFVTYTKNEERIAYRDLDLRHLWTIYEQLIDQKPIYLEGKIQLATEKKAKRKPESRRIPDQIVRYVVRNTLEPLCEGKSVSQILQLKVLDPAVGSGHFLVEVVDFLAEKIVTHSSFVDESDRMSTLFESNRSVDTESTRNADAERASNQTQSATGIPGGGNTEIAYWRRRIVESCVYGVDSNPMAIELTKLTLWLHTVSKGEPLSFLDHHIRSGNALVGAAIADLSNLPSIGKRRQAKQQASTPEFEMEFPFTATAAEAVGHYLQIEEMESRHAMQISAKEEKLDLAQIMLQPYKEVANLWLSRYFQHSIQHAEYHAALRSLTSGTVSTYIDPEAQHIATRQRFFHWEIEFPEVFRDKYGCRRSDAGFAAIVGSPPLRHQELTTDLRTFLATYHSYNGSATAYVYFVERSHQLLRPDGRLGLMIPNKFLQSAQARGLRRFLQHQSRLLKIIDLGDLPHFEALMPILLFAQNPVPPLSKKHLFQFAKVGAQGSEALTTVDKLEEVVNQVSVQLDQAQLESSPSGWQLVDPDLGRLLEKIDRSSISLKNYCRRVPIRRGVLTGLNQVLIVNQQVRNQLINNDPASRKVLRPIVTGSDILPYQTRFRQQYLINLPSTDSINRYPAIQAWLKPFQNQLNQRKERGENWWSLRSCDYLSLFDEPKIICSDSGAKFTLEPQGYYLSNTVYFIPKPDYYLLALLNSRLTRTCLNYNCVPNQSGSLRVTKRILEELPIYRPSPRNKFTDSSPTESEAEILNTITQFYYDTAGRQTDLLRFARQCRTEKRLEVFPSLLAFLSEKTLKLGQAIEQEVSGFITWLEREIGCTINDLRHKTKIQHYYLLPEGESASNRLLQVLKQNSLQINPSARSFQERLERELDASLSQLYEWSQQSKINQDLIDQVIYLFYNLTPYEVDLIQTSDTTAI